MTIDQQIQQVQATECIINQCDSHDRNACGHVTEIEEGISPTRVAGDTCPCTCHALYEERDRK